MIKVKKIRGKWRADFTLPVSKERRRPFLQSVSYSGALKEAEALLQDEMVNGSPNARRATEARRAPTFAEFVEDGFARLKMVSFRPGTREQYRTLLRIHLVPWFGEMRLDEIANKEWLQFEADLLLKEIKPRGCGNLMLTILKAAEEQGVIAERAQPAIKKTAAWRVGKKLPTCPKTPLVSRVYERADLPWVRTALGLIAYLGVRVSEAIAMEVQDVDLDVKANKVTVCRSLSAGEPVAPKSGHQRQIFVPDEFMPTLREAMRNKLPRAKIVTREDGTSPTRIQVLYELRKIQKELGETKLWGPHSFRHYYNTAMLTAGVPPQVVQQLMGHSSLAVTDRYSHAWDSDLEGAAEKLPKLNR